jgi:hypothetical protein
MCLVLAGLVPASTSFLNRGGAWMAGTSPAMTAMVVSVPPTTFEAGCSARYSALLTSLIFGVVASIKLR